MAAGKSSSARVNVRWTGVRFGSGFSQLDIDVEWTVFDSCDYASPRRLYLSELLYLAPFVCAVQGRDGGVGVFPA